MSEEYLRETFVYGTEFWDFYNSQTKQVQDKIDWVIDLVRSLKWFQKSFSNT